MQPPVAGEWMKRWAGPLRLYPKPSVLTILGTYRCTAECEHCCFDSSPHVQGQLGLNEIKSFIQEARDHTEAEMVVFSGGECFLLGDDLALAIEFATSLGFSTRCVTNGYWAKSEKAGRRILGRVKEAGLRQLNISTGDYHQRFVSEDTVANAASLGVEFDLEHTLVVVELKKDRIASRERLLQHPKMSRLVGLPESRFKIIESPWMPMSLDITIEQPEEVLLNRDTVHLRGGCSSIFSTLVLTPHRKLGVCCGQTRERIPDLNESWSEGQLVPLLIDASKDFMKAWLLVDGPEKILAWAAAKNSKIVWENRYAHHCHVCLALFRDAEVRETIRAHYRERIPDVLMRYALLLRAQQAEGLPAAGMPRDRSAIQ
jgi:organic radical activating enzyme